jgi:hypothetical protein
VTKSLDSILAAAKSKATGALRAWLVRLEAGESARREVVDQHKQQKFDVRK